MTFDDVTEMLAEECQKDHVGLWEVVDAVRAELGVANADVRSTTLRLVRRLLVERGIQAGQPTRDGRGFVPSNLPVDEELGRIELEWLKLDREPNIGEVAWFTTPDDAPVILPARR